MNWRSILKVPSTMDTSGARFLIDGFLPEGITVLGGLSRHGKTWFGLSIAKALFNQQKFLSQFTVRENLPIVYLVPEAGESAFGGRLKKMGLDAITDGFFVRTMKDGPPISLSSEYLLACVRELRPVVFLDTAIRFSNADDENDAMQHAKGLATGAFELMSAGAHAVIGLHHSPKIASKTDKNGKFKRPTLESGLRGSGDFGAMADTVYVLQCNDVDAFKIQVTCVKARDFEEPSPFVIQGRPYIDEIGDFKLITEFEPRLGANDIERLVNYVKLYPRATYRDIALALGISKNRILSLATQAGWKRKGDLWVSVVM